MNNNYIPFKTARIIMRTPVEYHVNHFYESINNNESQKNNYPLVSEKWDYYFINYLGQLSAVGSGIAPQLPPRNKINKQNITLTCPKNNEIDIFDQVKNKINNTKLTIHNYVKLNIKRYQKTTYQL